jgi:ankyrin repeat protein
MLHWQAIEGSPQIVEWLLGLGFDINQGDRGNKTPIYSAASRGSWETVRLLLAQGADLDLVNHIGETGRHPFMKAGVPEDLRLFGYQLTDLLDGEHPRWKQLASLLVLRPREVGGELCTIPLAEWAALVRADPDLSVWGEEAGPGDEDDYEFVDWTGHPGAQSIQFSIVPSMGLYVGTVDPAVGAKVESIAQSLSAVVHWRFEFNDRK